MIILNKMALCYIASIAFQLAGALILTVKFWGKTEKRVINGCFGEGNYAEINEEKKVVLTKKQLRESGRNIYLNRVAFIYIVTGSLLGIYGGVGDESRNIVLVSIIILSALAIILGIAISNIIARIVYRKDKAIDSNEIKKDIYTEIKEEDIQALFKKDVGPASNMTIQV